MQPSTDVLSPKVCLAIVNRPPLDISSSIFSISELSKSDLVGAELLLGMLAIEHDGDPLELLCLYSNGSVGSSVLLCHSNTHSLLDRFSVGRSSSLGNTTSHERKSSNKNI